MKISVVIPVYNVSAYLRECVDVVLAQSYTNIEVILVNDGSTDNSGAICDEYANQDARVRVIHQANAGLSEARNTGTRSACGDYLIYLDSDDKWSDIDFLEKLVNRAQQTNADVILFPCQRFVDNMKINTNGLSMFRPHDFVGRGMEVFERLVLTQQFPISACCKMIRLEILQKNKINFYPGLLGEDMDWNQRLMPHVQSMSYCNDVYYLYRERPNSITTTYRLKNAQDFCWILETWKQHWEISSESYKHVFLQYLALLYVTLVYKYLFIPKTDRKAVRSRILELSTLLRYSATKKSNRLLLLKRCVGSYGMLYIAAAVQYVKKKVCLIRGNE